jgi:hypothetical protein
LAENILGKHNKLQKELNTEEDLQLDYLVSLPIDNLLMIENNIKNTKDSNKKKMKKKNENMDRYQFIKL